MSLTSGVGYEPDGGTGDRATPRRVVGGRIRHPREYDYDERGVDRALAAASLTSTRLSDLKDAIVPIRRLPSLPKLDGGVVLQRWEGRVDRVSDDGFVARLKDLTGKTPEEVAEFPIEETSVADRPLIQPGAVFYWSIGYRDATTGQRSRESVIRFRRLPQWTRRDREEAVARVARWKSSFESRDYLDRAALTRRGRSGALRSRQR